MIRMELFLTGTKQLNLEDSGGFSLIEDYENNNINDINTQNVNIENIIKTIDNDLIDRGKSYLLLRQAYKLLVEKGILISEGKLKRYWKKIRFMLI